FDFAAGNGFCLSLVAISPALVACAFRFPSGFLTSVPAIFDFGASDGLCRPAAIALELAPTVSTLRLPSCFLPSVAKFFGLSTGKRIDLPVALALAEFALPLPSCFPPPRSAIFAFARADAFCRPFALARPLACLALPLSPCFLTSSATTLGFRGRNASRRWPRRCRLTLPYSCRPASRLRAR